MHDLVAQALIDDHHRRASAARRARALRPPRRRRTPFRRWSIARARARAETREQWA